MENISLFSQPASARVWSLGEFLCVCADMYEISGGGELWLSCGRKVIKQFVPKELDDHASQRVNLESILVPNGILVRHATHLLHGVARFVEAQLRVAKGERFC